MHTSKTRVGTHEVRTVSSIGYTQVVVRDVVENRGAITGFEGRWIGVRSSGRL